MTEAEWLKCDNSVAMIEFLRGSPVGEDEVSWGKNREQWNDLPCSRDRRFRLFACKCCRRIWDEIPFECNRAAVMAVEELLEGCISPDQAHKAFIASSAVEWEEDGSARRTEPGYWVVKVLGRGFYKMTAGASALLIAARVICMTDHDYGREAEREFDACYYVGGGVFLRPFRWPVPIPPAPRAELEFQVALLHDLFRNPFRPVAFSPQWRTETVNEIARQMYESRDFSAMPILADALQDAGCDNADILNHCRSAGPHARGCWVVDLALGKG
jgi:hypothetical protein